MSVASVFRRGGGEGAFARTARDSNATQPAVRHWPEGNRSGAGDSVADASTMISCRLADRGDSEESVAEGRSRGESGVEPLPVDEHLEDE